MNWDFTVPQSGDDERQARELSLRHTSPPTQVPGYDLNLVLGPTVRFRDNGVNLDTQALQVPDPLGEGQATH